MVPPAAQNVIQAAQVNAVQKPAKADPVKIVPIHAAALLGQTKDVAETDVR
jgi:hypothetical protein